MNVLITGGAGFIGQRLARRLLALGTLTDAQGQAQQIERLTLLDVVPAPDLHDQRVRVLSGDIAQAGVIESALELSLIHI